MHGLTMNDCGLVLLAGGSLPCITEAHLSAGIRYNHNYLLLARDAGLTPLKLSIGYEENTERRTTYVCSYVTAREPMNVE
jgi:hypothetical protein